MQDNFSIDEKDNSLTWFKIVMSLFSLTEVVSDLKDIFKFQLLVFAHFKAQRNRNSKMQRKKLRIAFLQIDFFE